QTVPHPRRHLRIERDDGLAVWRRPRQRLAAIAAIALAGAVGRVRGSQPPGTEQPGRACVARGVVCAVRWAQDGDGSGTDRWPASLGGDVAAGSGGDGFGGGCAREATGQGVGDVLTGLFAGKPAPTLVLYCSQTPVGAGL